MDLRKITPDDIKSYNALVTHVMQSFQWGEFKEQTGVEVLRYGIYRNNKLAAAFQLTLHKIPFINKYVGYLPRGLELNSELADALEQVAKEYNLVFIKLEPHIPKASKQVIDLRFKKATKSYFSKYNFIIDLTKSEQDLLSSMRSKTRYNIRLAQKKGVKIKIGTDPKIFNDYLNLYFETTARQNYLGHNRDYHKKVWELFQKYDMAKIIVGYFKDEPLSAWCVFNFKDTLYYPYGGSTHRHKELMANNLVAWEAINLGKKLKLKKFDMWGALGENPDPNDPWIGFHNFKQGYGGQHIEYIGSFDIIFDKLIYQIFNFIDSANKLKFFLLKLIGR